MNEWKHQPYNRKSGNRLIVGHYWAACLIAQQSLLTTLNCPASASPLRTFACYISDNSIVRHIDSSRFTYLYCFQHSFMPHNGFENITHQINTHFVLHSSSVALVSCPTKYQFNIAYIYNMFIMRRSMSIYKKAIKAY